MADEDMLYVELPNFSNDEYGYVFAIDDIKSMNLLCDAISIGTKAQIVTDEPFKVSGNEKFSYKDVYGLVTILKPAVSFSDLETVAYTSLSDYILNISPVKTNENGSFELTFIYNGTESSVGEKNTYFNVKNTIDNTSQTSLMPYFKTNTLNTYVDELKKITLQTDFVDKFNKCLEVFKFDKKYYDLLSDKDEMAKILFNIGFEDKESLLSTLQK